MVFSWKSHPFSSNRINVLLLIVARSFVISLVEIGWINVALAFFFKSAFFLANDVEIGDASVVYAYIFFLFSFLTSRAYLDQPSLRIGTYFFGFMATLDCYYHVGRGFTSLDYVLV
jgi:hypothetical protein